jgi:hypothetical protein
MWQPRPGAGPLSAQTTTQGFGEAATAAIKSAKRELSGVSPGVVESMVTVTAYPTIGSDWGTRQRNRTSE